MQSWALIHWLMFPTRKKISINYIKIMLHLPNKLLLKLSKDTLLLFLLIRSIKIEANNNVKNLSSRAIFKAKKFMLMVLFMYGLLKMILSAMIKKSMAAPPEGKSTSKSGILALWKEIKISCLITSTMF